MNAAQSRAEQSRAGRADQLQTMQRMNSLYAVTDVWTRVMWECERVHAQRSLSVRVDSWMVRECMNVIVVTSGRFWKGGWYGWKPSSSSNFSIRVFRAYPLIQIRQTVPCPAIRGNSISVNITLPPLTFVSLRTAIWECRLRSYCFRRRLGHPGCLEATTKTTHASSHYRQCSYSVIPSFV